MYFGLVFHPLRMRTSCNFKTKMVSYHRSLADSIATTALPENTVDEDEVEE